MLNRGDAVIVNTPPPAGMARVEWGRARRRGRVVDLRDLATVAVPCGGPAGLLIVADVSCFELKGKVSDEESQNEATTS